MALPKVFRSLVMLPLTAIPRAALLSSPTVVGVSTVSAERRPAPTERSEKMFADPWVTSLRQGPPRDRS